MRHMRLRCAGGGVLRTVDAAGYGAVVAAWLWAWVWWNWSREPSVFALRRQRQGILPRA